MASPHLVLLGGGHAMLPSLVHAREWASNGVEVTLIDPQRYLYYSGMVPEYLGGVYDEADVRIDLARRARENGVAFVQSAATHLAPDERRVTTAAGETYPFDVLAIDVGGANPAVPPAATATKPIYRLRSLAERIETTLDTATASLRLAVVGGGAAGTEVALNVSGRFAGAGRLGDLQLTVLEQADRLLPGFPRGMSARATQYLRRRGATVRVSTTVAGVEATDQNASVVRTDTAAPVSVDAVLWATGTVGPPLLRDGPLPTDDRGFLRVTRSLRAASQSRIFAAGDCASVEGLDLARVGVHAVKQGSILRTNLGRTLRALSAGADVPSADTLRAFRPYPITPLILSTGTPDGLWTAGPLWASHPWLLRLKHWIDRRWIRRYAPEQWGDASWTDVLRPDAAIDSA